MSKHFSDAEFACRCCGKLPACGMNKKLIALLDDMRADLGVPLVAGYRCPAHNAAVGGVPNSQHCDGTAADIDATGIGVEKLAALAEKHKADGVGRYFDGGFVHVDVRSGRIGDNKRRLEKVKTYKGTGKDMKCRDMQYEIGKTFEEKNVSVCNSGLHSCEYPLDVFKYYGPSANRYFECEADGTIEKETGGDSKIASTKLTLRTEIGIPGLVKATIEYVKARTTTENTAGDSGAATAGDRGAATAGDWGAATAGDRGAATAGDGGAATAGERGFAIANTGGKVRGGMGTILVLANRDDNGKVIEFAAGYVDGKKIKANTFYALRKGEFVEVG